MRVYYKIKVPFQVKSPLDMSGKLTVIQTQFTCTTDKSSREETYTFTITIDTVGGENKTMFNSLILYNTEIAIALVFITIAVALADFCYSLKLFSCDKEHRIKFAVSNLLEHLPLYIMLFTVATMMYFIEYFV